MLKGVKTWTWRQQITLSETHVALRSGGGDGTWVAMLFQKRFQTYQNTARGMIKWDITSIYDLNFSFISLRSIWKSRDWKAMGKSELSRASKSIRITFILALGAETVKHAHTGEPPWWWSIKVTIMLSNKTETSYFQQNSTRFKCNGLMNPMVDQQWVII